MQVGPRLVRFVTLFLAASFLAGAFHDADAAGRKRRPAKRTARKAAVPVGPTHASALVLDASTGQVLYEKSPHVLRAPASLAKMMLELLAFEAVRRGEMGLYDEVTVTKEATAVRGSRVRLTAGEVVTVRDLIAATAIASANDAASALAVRLAGSTEACLERMNRRARELGMRSTVYHNVHGLDRPGEPGNVTTAWDLAILARALIEMPEILEISSTAQTTIRKSQVIRTTNRLLGRYPGIDGLKTGYTSRAGFCLVASVERDGMRLISVVLGASSNRRRFSETADLLNNAFRDWQRVCVLSKGQDLGQDLSVRLGRADTVRLLAGCDLNVLVPAKRKNEIRVAVSVPPSTRAPVVEGWTLGRVQVLLGDSVAAEGPAVAGGAVARASVIDRMFSTSKD